jgi:hypothetical protein
MIVSHAHRYLFVQVPRTACTAIARELCERYGGKPVLRKHAHLAEYEAVVGALPRGTFVFGSIRHPLSALVGHYFKLRTDHQGRFSASLAGESPPPGEMGPSEDTLARYRFVQEEGADFPAYFRRFAPRLYDNPYHDGIRDRFDFVIRFEELQRDFRAAMAQVGLAVERDVPVVNRTGGKDDDDFWRYFEPELRERAVRAYGPYMRRTGYGFPASWGEVRVPAAAQLEFDLARAAGRVAARALRLPPARAQRVRDAAARGTRRLARTLRLA